MSITSIICIIYLVSSALSEELQSFSIKTGSYTYSKSNNILTLTVWFNQYLYQCAIIPSVINTEYSCDASAHFIGCDPSSDNIGAKMLFENPGADGVDFTATITTNLGTYTISGICINDAETIGPLFADAFAGDDALCDTGYSQYNKMCIDLDHCIPTKQLVYFDTTAPNTAIQNAVWENGLAVTYDTVGTEYCTATTDCNIHNFTWEDLMNSETGKPSAVATLSVDESTLSLQVNIVADYLGFSAADDNGFLYGTTYVVDFEDFDAHEANIREAGNCENRESDAFSDTSLTWSDVWSYSETPFTDGHIASSDYLAYAPGNKWTLSMVEDDTCSIEYSANFTWNELVSCTDYDESNGFYVTTSDNANNITLSGTLYINVVSPYDYGADYHYYRVYQLLSQPFMIVVSKTTYVLGEVGINLLTMNIIAVYKEDQENEFRLIILTESAEYLRLSRDTLGEESSLFQAFVPFDESNPITSDDFRMLETAETGSDCLSNKEYICSQLWEFKAENAQCTTGGIFTDFSGTYSIQFTPECRSALELGDTALFEYCEQWKSDHEDEITDSTAGDKVLLSAELSWKDEICDPQIFEVQFAATMQFYTDAAYSDEVADPSTGHLFQVGEDTIYVKVTTDYPVNTFSVFETELLNVWICTFDPLAPPDDIDVASQSGGCFSAHKDDNSDRFIEHIYNLDNGVALENFTLDSSSSLQSNEIQFQFNVPDKVVRDTLYIHAQIEVALSVSGRRRRMVIDAQGTKQANQMEHFLNKVGIYHDVPYQKPPKEPLPLQPVQEPLSWLNSLQSPWTIAIVCAAAALLAINAMFICYVNCVKPNRTTRYAPIKAVDSSDFSEHDAINVESN